MKTITISRAGEAGGWLLPLAFFGPGVLCIVLALSL
jgi:hypothetical protein